MTAVSIRGLSKRIRGSIVLDNVSLEVPPGAIVGFSGINGSGKTMLLRAIAGLIRPSSGEVVVGGSRLGKELDFPPRTGLLIESPAFLELRTGLKNLEMLASIRQGVSAEAPAGAMEAMGLDPADKRTFRKYSLGMKQRLGIAAALMGSPALVLLDEPTNALDERSASLFYTFFERQHGASGFTAFVASHDKEVLRTLCETVYKIEDGKIVGCEAVR